MRFSPRTSKISLLATIKLSYIIKNWFIVYCSLFIIFFLFFCTFNILIAISNFIVTDYFTNIVKCKYLEGYCEHKKLCEINKSSIQISKNLYNIIY